MSTGANAKSNRIDGSVPPSCSDTYPTYDNLSSFRDRTCRWMGIPSTVMLSDQMLLDMYEIRRFQSDACISAEFFIGVDDDQRLAAAVFLLHTRRIESVQRDGHVAYRMTQRGLDAARVASTTWLFMKVERHDLDECRKLFDPDVTIRGMDFRSRAVLRPLLVSIYDFICAIGAEPTFESITDSDCEPQTIGALAILKEYGLISCGFPDKDESFVTITANGYVLVREFKGMPDPTLSDVPKKLEPCFL